MQQPIFFFHITKKFSIISVSTFLSFDFFGFSSDVSFLISEDERMYNAFKESNAFSIKEFCLDIFVIKYLYSFFIASIMNKMSSRIVRVAAASRLAQEF